MSDNKEHKKLSSTVSTEIDTWANYKWTRSGAASTRAQLSTCEL